VVLADHTPLTGEYGTNKPELAGVVAPGGRLTPRSTPVRRCYRPATKPRSMEAWASRGAPVSSAPRVITDDRQGPVPPDG